MWPLSFSQSLLICESPSVIYPSSKGYQLKVAIRCPCFFSKSLFFLKMPSIFSPRYKGHQFEAFVTCPFFLTQSLFFLQMAKATVLRSMPRRL